ADLQDAFSAAILGASGHWTLVRQTRQGGSDELSDSCSSGERNRDRLSNSHVRLGTEQGPIHGSHGNRRPYSRRSPRPPGLLDDPDVHAAAATRSPSRERIL